MTAVYQLKITCPVPPVLYTSRFDRTAKRFNRIAQAFRPGKTPSKSALKGRPTGTAENEYHDIHVEGPSHSDALSGRVPCGKNPGLEGLGYGLLPLRGRAAPFRAENAWACPQCRIGLQPVFTASAIKPLVNPRRKPRHPKPHLSQNLHLAGSKIVDAA